MLGPAAGSALAGRDVNLQENIGPVTCGISWMVWALATVFLVMRIYLKITRTLKLWWDDYVLLASYVLITAATCADTYMTSVGLGKHLYEIEFGNLMEIARVGLVMGALMVAATSWSKLSFAITMLRFTKGWMKGFVWFIIISLNVVSAANGLASWVSASSVSRIWNPLAIGEDWPIAVTNGIIIGGTVYSAFCDIALAVIPGFIVKRTMMKRREKIGLGAAMSMGFLAGIMAVLKTVEISRMNLLDASYSGARIYLYGLIEVDITIIACSLPQLRVLFKDRAARRLQRTREATGGTSNGGTVSGGTRTGTVTGGPGLREDTPMDDEKAVSSSDGSTQRSNDSVHERLEEGESLA